MVRVQFRLLAVTAFAAVLFVPSRVATAHFLWLKTVPAEGGKQQAFLYFGESAADETYHFPEKLTGTKIWQRPANGKRTELPAEPIDTDDRVGRLAPLKGDQAFVLEAAAQYGVYGMMLLNYCAKHVRAPSNDELSAAG